tara:strand:+ start:483 stop:1277 length:795 start_codon:yes stop_codon:yes gene_type:complete
MPDRLQLSTNPQEAIEQLDNAMLDYADTLVYTHQLAYNVAKEFFVMDATQRSDIDMFRNLISPFGVLDATVSLAMDQNSKEAKIAVTLQRTVEVNGFELPSENFTTQVHMTKDLSIVDFIRVNRPEQGKEELGPSQAEIYDKIYEPVFLRMLRRQVLPGGRAAYSQGTFHNTGRFETLGPNGDLRYQIFGENATLPGGWLNRLERDSGGFISSRDEELKEVAMTIVFDAISNALREALVAFFYKPGNTIAVLLGKTLEKWQEVA